MNIGKPTPQLSSYDKVTGKAKYTDDIKIDNPLFIKLLRSPHASAKIKKIDLQNAKKISGVKAVITGLEFNKKFGVLSISKDELPLAQEVVRYVGEAVVAVAAENEETALMAIREVIIEYEIKTPCLNAKEALKPTSDLIHPELKKETNIHKSVSQKFGDTEKGFKEAETVMKEKFTFFPINHAFTEPHATKVIIDNNSDLTVYSATQVPHYLHKALSEVLEIPLHKIRVIKPHLGGGFGGKSDPFSHEIIAAKLALITGRNTSITLTREEVFFVNHGRHPTEIEMWLGLHSEKGITALDANILIDGGAYGSFGVVTTYYNGVLLNGPYMIPNFSFHCDRVYTNKPMCGAMRGHGGVNPRFASEVLLDMACVGLKLDPCDARIKLIHEENTITPNEFRITSCSLKQGLKQAVEKTKWKEKYQKLQYGQGIGVACGFFISGSALPIHRNEMPQSTVRLTLDLDGKVTLFTGASDIGQGSDTVLAQIVGSVLGLPTSMIHVISADTRLCPIDLGSYSSRVTFMAGNAARNAAISMRKLLVDAACEILEIRKPFYEKPEPPRDFFRQGMGKPDFTEPYLGANPNYADEFLFEDFKITYVGLGGVSSSVRSVSYFDVLQRALWGKGALQTSGNYISPKMGGTYKGSGAGLSPAYSFTAFITEVDVNTQTGFIKVKKTTCVHDCGFPINPLAVEGQIEGSIHMGLGQALMEQMIYDDGVLQGVLAPFIPSIANAVYDAVGVRLLDLPMTPDRVLKAIREGRK
ncbi:MAG: molybdopterin-dependent oxidoreductase [Deltaproteobacteria bacterium]|nr:molybdopterin-dependent oxidoreductase [Deltaproteobacteria bacterium]